MELPAEGVFSPDVTAAWSVRIGSELSTTLDKPLVRAVLDHNFIGALIVRSKPPAGILDDIAHIP
ncbi:hypothetical protein D3C75_1011930 [compost metagenome]